VISRPTAVARPKEIVPPNEMLVLHQLEERDEEAADRSVERNLFDHGERSLQSGGLHVMHTRSVLPALFALTASAQEPFVRAT
jgi:hypothetical protein